MAQPARANQREFRYWVFTCNLNARIAENPEEQGTPELEPIIEQSWPKVVRYCVWSLERGEQGNLHWQGYLELTATRKLTYVRRLAGLQGSHFEPR